MLKLCLLEIRVGKVSTYAQLMKPIDAKPIRFAIDSGKQSANIGDDGLVDLSPIPNGNLQIEFKLDASDQWNLTVPRASDSIDTASLQYVGPPVDAVRPDVKIDVAFKRGKQGDLTVNLTASVKVKYPERPFERPFRNGGRWVGLSEVNYDKPVDDNRVYLSLTDISKEVFDDFTPKKSFDNDLLKKFVNGMTLKEVFVCVESYIQPARDWLDGENGPGDDSQGDIFERRINNLEKIVEFNKKQIDAAEQLLKELSSSGSLGVTVHGPGRIKGAGWCSAGLGLRVTDHVPGWKMVEVGVL